MTDDEPGVGVRDLVEAVRELQDAFELDTVRISKRTSDGHLISLTFCTGMPLLIEREDGHVQVIGGP